MAADEWNNGVDLGRVAPRPEQNCIPFSAAPLSLSRLEEATSKGTISLDKRQYSNFIISSSMA